MLFKKTDKPRDPLWLHFLIASAVALAAGYVDAKLSYKFGASISTDVAFGLAAISVGSGVGWVLVIKYWRQGHQGFAQALGCVMCAVTAFNILSNMGVSTANRVVEVQTANLNQEVHEERGKSKEEAKARLAIFEKQHKDLLTKNAWAASVTASGLREQVADLRVSRESESKLGGCGPKCRAIENQITDIQGKIAVAEQRQTLDKRIDATKAVLASAREILEKSDAGVSHTAAQASLYSRWTVGWLGDGESVSAVRNANELMGVGMAIVIALASAGFTLAGAWPYLMNITPDAPNTGARSLPSMSKDVSAEPSAAPAAHKTEVTVVEREPTQPQLQVMHVPFSEWRERFADRGQVAA